MGFKYLVIDTETTSIDPENGDLLSFAAVIEDTDNILPLNELPSFYCVFKHEKLRGEPYALNMNKELIREISEGVSPNLIEPGEFVEQFNTFLKLNGLDYFIEEETKKPVKIKSCGKNFATFDKGWIEKKIPYFTDYFAFNHRVLDPGSLFVDFKNDDWLPNLHTCMKRAGVKGEVTHNALQDCLDLLESIRTKYNG